MTEAIVLPEVTIDSLLASGWKDIIDGVAEKDCYAFARALQEAAALTSKTNLLRTAGLSFLADLCVPRLWNDEEGGLAPARLIAAFSDADLDLVEALSAHVADPELSARLHDILWLRRRSRSAAATAVRAYLESAARLFDPKAWTTCFARTQRALNIAVHFGRNNALYAEVMDAIEADLVKLEAGDPLHLSSKLMELQLGERSGDPVKGTARATSFAEAAARDGDGWRANKLYELAAQWSRRANDADGARRASIGAAEAFVAFAKARAETDPGGATMNLQAAIEAYRRIGKEQARVDELRKLMAEYQQRAAERFASFSTSVDLTDEVKRTMNQVRGKPTVLDALVALATATRSASVSTIRETVQAGVAHSPLRTLVTQVAVENKTGRVTARQPASNGSADDTWLQTEMFKHAKLLQHLTASFLEPSRRLILEEHPFTHHDLLPLVSSSPFVPPGREERFARGLAAGLRGDFLLATALLVPQIENSLRFVVEQRGGHAYALGTDGVQPAHLLTHLLGLPLVEQLLGEDIVFDLRGLLNEQMGSNLRNLDAHGLLDDHEYNSTAVAYFWWLTLRLCVVFSLAAGKYAERAEKAAVDNDGQEEKPEKEQP